MTIILDNGGGITLQINKWAHFFDGQPGNSAHEAAECLCDYRRDKSTSGWDGHEDEAAECNPTAEDIRNGGYRVLHSTRELDIDSAWHNARDLAAAVSAISAARALRAIPSERRSQASRDNGKRGGRPRSKP